MENTFKDEFTWNRPTNEEVALMYASGGSEIPTEKQPDIILTIKLKTPNKMETQVTENIEVTIQERIYAMRTALSAQFLEKLKELGLHIAENAMVVINETQVEIGIRKDEFNFEFASEFPIYSRKMPYGDGKTENSMNVSSSGTFNPNNTAPFWRTIHAGEVLKNWDSVCEIVNHFCGLFAKFLENLRAIQKEVEKYCDGEIMFMDSPIPSYHMYAIRGVLCDFYQSQRNVFVYVKP